jgi:hypothetical protein
MKDKVVMDFNDLEGQLSSDSDEQKSSLVRRQDIGTKRKVRKRRRTCAISHKEVE